MEDQVTTEVNWRTYGLPTVETWKRNTAAVEAIRAATYQAVIENTEELVEIAIARNARLSEFARQAAQLSPQDSDFIRAAVNEYRVGALNTIARYRQEPR